MVVRSSAMLSLYEKKSESNGLRPQAKRTTITQWNVCPEKWHTTQRYWWRWWRRRPQRDANDGGCTRRVKLQVNWNLYGSIRVQIMINWNAFFGRQKWNACKENIDLGNRDVFCCVMLWWWYFSGCVELNWWQNGAFHLNSSWKFADENELLKRFTVILMSLSCIRTQWFPIAKKIDSFGRDSSNSNPFQLKVLSE